MEVLPKKFLLNEVSFHYRISSTDSKTRTTLYSIIESAAQRQLSFEWSDYRI